MFNSDSLEQDYQRASSRLHKHLEQISFFFLIIIILRLTSIYVYHYGHFGPLDIFLSLLLILFVFTSLLQPHVQHTLEHQHLLNETSKRRLVTHYQLIHHEKEKYNETIGRYLTFNRVLMLFFAFTILFIIIPIFVMAVHQSLFELKIIQG